MPQPAFTFVFPSLINGRLFQGFDYHLGTGHIRAFLSEYGIQTSQFIHRGNEALPALASKILADEPRLIGISCYDNNYHVNRTIATEIRRQSPHTPIIFGGPSATFSGEAILGDCPAVDVCCRSYAEETALDLVRWIHNEIPLDAVKGIWFRKGGEIIRTADRTVAPIPENDHPNANPGLRSKHTLDRYPDPYLSGFLPASRVSDVGLVTSRGCTFPCTFCNFSAMSGRSLTTHSVDYVMSVFQYLERQFENAEQPQLVTINDDNFSLQGKRFHELLARMADASFKNICFWAEMRTETLREESFPLLKKAGFREVNFGLESAVPRVLAAMKKVRNSGWEHDEHAKERAYLQRIAWAVAASRRADIRTTVSIILGGPTETPADGQATLDFVRDLRVDSYSHNFLGIGAGTELADTYKEWGLVVDTPPDRILPFVTKVAYGVYKLKILSNDRAWLPMAGFEMKHVNRLMTGTKEGEYSAENPRPNGRGGAGRANPPGAEHEPEADHPIIAVVDPAFDDETVRWLAQTMSMNISLWLLHWNPESRNLAQGMLNKWRVPIQQINSVRRVEHDDLVVDRINEFAADAPDFNTRTTYTIPLRQVGSNDLSALCADSRSVLYFAIDSKDDVERLIDLTPIEGEPGDWILGSELISHRAAVKDACRWCSGGCPADRGNRWIVAADKAVHPCHNSLAVGRVGQAPAQWRESAARLKEEAEKRRGCATCPVNATCSKCIFTHPLDEVEYCRIRRERPAVSALMVGLNLCRVLVDAKMLTEGPVRVTSLATVSSAYIQLSDKSVSVSNCLIIEGSEDAFLYSERDNFFARVSRAGVRELRALLAHDNPNLLLSMAFGRVAEVTRPAGDGNDGMPKHPQRYALVDSSEPVAEVATHQLEGVLGTVATEVNSAPAE